MDGNQIFMWLVLTGVGIGGSLIMWLMNRAINRIDSDIEGHDELLRNHTQKHADCSLDLANFKTEVANTYSKEATTQASLARIHDRLDRLPREIIDALKGAKP